MPNPNLYQGLVIFAILRWKTVGLHESEGLLCQFVLKTSRSSSRKYDSYCVVARINFACQYNWRLGEENLYQEETRGPLIHSAMYQDTTSNSVKGRRPSLVLLIFNTSISRSKPKQHRETSRTFFRNRKLQALVPAENDIIENFVCLRRRNL